MNVKEEIFQLYRLSVLTQTLLGQDTSVPILTRILAEIGKLALNTNIANEELEKLCKQAQDNPIMSRTVKYFLSNDARLSLEN